MRRLLENATKLEHLGLILKEHATERILPRKLPSNLKSFSLLLHIDEFYADPSSLIENIARDCKNLKILQLEHELLDSQMILAIGNIKRYKWKK